MEKQPEDVRSVLAELLRLYDWRNELGRIERDFNHDKKQMKTWLNQYGREKKAAWEAAVRVLSATSSTPTNDMQLWQGPWNDGPAPYYKIPCADYHRLQQKIKDEEKLRESWREQASIWQQRSTPSATLVSDGVMEPCVQAFDAYNDGRIDADECVCLMATALQIVLRRADDTTKEGT